MSTIGPSSNSTVEEEKTFQWQDYLIFALSLGISVFIGVFFFVKAKLEKRCRKKNSTDTKSAEANENADVDEYLKGGGNMNPIPVAVSIIASVMNAIFIIGYPAEIHYNGAIFLLNATCLAIVIPLAALIVVPVFHSLPLTSAYEYLELRFGMPVRAVASIAYFLSALLTLGAVLYAPSLTFSQVTNIDIWIIIVISGGLCTFYTFLGGMKGVIWSDTIQMVIILVGLIVLCALGAEKAGGGRAIYDDNFNNGRLNFNNISPNPTTRHTIWTQVFGMVFTILPIYGANQMIIQRYFAIKKLRGVQIAIVVASSIHEILTVLIGILGLVISSYYRKCDPLVARKIKKGDELVPYFMLQTLGAYPGVPGLFTAAIFAAALSTVASTINSLAAVVLEDFIKPIYNRTQTKAFPVNKSAHVTRGLSLLFGLFTIGLAFVTPYLGSKIVQVPLTINGVILAPMFAVFVTGFFLKFCEKWGALFGLLTGFSITMWVAVGSIMYTSAPPPLPLGTCIGNRTIVPTAAPPPDNVSQTLLNWYNISYVWYGVVGFFVTFFATMIISGIVALARRGRIPSVESRLLHSWVTHGCCKSRPVEENTQEKEVPHSNGVHYSNGVDKKSPTTKGYDNRGYTNYTDINPNVNKRYHIPRESSSTYL